MPDVCRTVSGWSGGGGRGIPPPPPPSPPGGPQRILLPATLPRPTPIQSVQVNDTSPSGIVLSVDSRSLLEDGVRIYPITGEIHLARLPQSEWREQLMRMKAGGLNWISVYLFWIYFEEAEGRFTFGGRRDVRDFVRLAGSLGLRVLLRIGPWCHGEVRNGGHPDWALRSCGVLRTTDERYMRCVSRWYAALSTQINDLFWKDGGPVVAVQVDNETRDWRYLLALRALAISSGIRPALFVKTGWPAPATGFPQDYPMLPLFGGYADLFWSNAMSPGASPQSFAFAREPRGWLVPDGYPWIDVEIGGGMAAAYNHRVHMSPTDMPAMHLVDVGSGVNGLGYYMYHGGNNPHSLLHDDDDAPETTLQESSFQPAGAQNPMPSISYDFFAPLGEFGQPRQHYHSMRRLHLLALRFGSELAGTVATLPPTAFPGTADNHTLRWSVRTNGRSGFLFVNNYQRLSSLTAKPNVRFLLDWSDGGSLAVPSNQSEPLTIPSASFFVWPLGLMLFPSGPSDASTPIASDGPQLAWATAQLLTELSVSASTSVIFLLQTAGIAPEVALTLRDGSNMTHHVGSVSVEGGYTVLRGLQSGYEAVATVQFGARTASLVLLPATQADKAWTAHLAGRSRLLLSEDADLLLAEGDLLHVRAHAERSRLKVLICPPLTSLSIVGGSVLPQKREGVFASFAVSQPPSQLPATLMPTLVRPAGPPRAIPLAPSGKPREPTAKEWRAAAEYKIDLGALVMASGANVEVRLAVDYAADCARVYLGDTLLTDNWLSGYYGSDGALEVGLTYMAGELPELLQSNATLRLLLLPLQKASLKKDIWLQPAHWPDFRGQEIVCRLDAVRVLAVRRTELRAVEMDG